MGLKIIKLVIVNILIYLFLAFLFNDLLFIIADYKDAAKLGVIRFVYVLLALIVSGVYWDSLKSDKDGKKQSLKGW